MSVRNANYRIYTYVNRTERGDDSFFKQTRTDVNQYMDNKKAAIPR